MIFVTYGGLRGTSWVYGAHYITSCLSRQWRLVPHRPVTLCVCLSGDAVFVSTVTSLVLLAWCYRMWDLVFMWAVKSNDLRSHIFTYPMTYTGIYVSCHITKVLTYPGEVKYLSHVTHLSSDFTCLHGLWGNKFTVPTSPMTSHIYRECDVMRSYLATWDLPEPGSPRSRKTSRGGRVNRPGGDSRSSKAVWNIKKLKSLCFGSGIYQVSGSGSVFWIRIQEGKNDPQKLIPTLPHLPPSRFHRVGGCRDWAQDYCNVSTNSLRWCFDERVILLKGTVSWDGFRQYSTGI